MKEKIHKIVEHAKELRTQAKKLTVDTTKTVNSLRGILSVGMHGGAAAFKKASSLVDKDSIGHGLEKTSKGIALMAKGAHLASKSADTVACTMENASDKVRKFAGKLKRKPAN